VALAWFSGAAGTLVLILLLAEALFRVLPVTNGVHRQNPRGTGSSARLVASTPYTWSMGWDLRFPTSGRTNAMGFISPHEYTSDKRAVALFGDSFVEAQMLPYEQSLAGQLDALWRGRMIAHNYGASGAALPHYLGMAREMGARFRFRAAVVVVTPGDYTEGFARLEGLYRWGDGGELAQLEPALQRDEVLLFARELALVRYLRGNLHLTLHQLAARQAVTCRPARLARADHERLERYLDELQRALRLPPQKIVLVSNVLINDIYDRVDRPAAARCSDLDSQALAELARLADERGMKRVDVGRLLEARYRAEHRLLNFKPVDGHWNGAATAIVALEISRQLADQLPLEELAGR